MSSPEVRCMREHRIRVAIGLTGDEFRSVPVHEPVILQVTRLPAHDAFHTSACEVLEHVLLAGMNCELRRDLDGAHGCPGMSGGGCTRSAGRPILGDRGAFAQALAPATRRVAELGVRVQGRTPCLTPWASGVRSALPRQPPGKENTDARATPPATVAGIRTWNGRFGRVPFPDLTKSWLGRETCLRPVPDPLP